MHTLFFMCFCKCNVQYLSNGPLDKWTTRLASPVHTLVVVLWVTEVVSLHALPSCIAEEVKELKQ